MDYRKATSADISKIILLWEELFGDPEDCVTHFITHFGIETCYVCEINSKIVAIAFALPTLLILPSNFDEELVERGNFYKNLPVKYLYACGTHPKHRKQGIMQILLATIYDDAYRENVAGVFLSAATPHLANYYRKLGFEDFFYRNHFWYYKDILLAEETPPVNVINFISPKTYLKKRVKMLESTCFVNWNEDFFRFINNEKTQLCEYKDTIFSCKTEFNKIVVDEFLGDMPKEHLARLLIEHFPDFETVHIRSQGNEYCCGQIKWCKYLEKQPKNGYFVFAME